jgi:putative aldouronate transport system permease protein
MRKQQLTAADVMLFILLGVFCFTTIYPFWSIIVISFTEAKAYFSSEYHLIPNSFSLEAYSYNFENPLLLRSLFISIFVTAAGTANSLFWTIITAYFLSKKKLAFVTILAILFLIPLYFDGGLIPNFVLIRQLGLRNNLLSIILPFTIHPFFLILTVSYFASRNPEIEEAAIVDGAGSFTVLFRIVVPTAKPILATIGLFYAVQYWNDWFWPMIYLTDRDLFPLALYLRNVISQSTWVTVDPGVAGNTNPATVRAATIVIAILPIILVYPFVQRYFVHGIMLGSTKE